jgi:DNA-binding NtrC family response regulator
MPSLFLIEDEATFAKNVASYLSRYGWDVEIAANAEDALARIPAVGPDVIVLDFNLPGMNGLEAIAVLRERDPEARIVMLTGHASVQLAVDAMKAGTADFLPKPVALAELRALVDRLASHGRARKELAYYHQRDAEGLDKLIGECAAIVDLKRRVRSVVQSEPVTSDAPPPSILIIGETGTGKEIVARACHVESRRRDQPFVEVNCASIPANLLESELFGHERGAFTDARERKTGLFEAADGGSIFLDEIGEADLAVQAKLLKVLEDQRIRRVGSLVERRVDVRIIAATNRDLESRVQQGSFRADLLYRLRVILLALPPLRSRGDDVQLLATAFLRKAAKRYAKPGLVFSTEALEKLLRYPWPGNVREMRNVLEQTVLLAAEKTVRADDIVLPDVAPDSSTAPTGSNEGIELAAVERDMIRKALDNCGRNVTQAARQLGISRDTLRYRMEKHGLTRSEGAAPRDG